MLPVFVILAITAFVVLFGVSALTVIMPMFGSVVWAAVFLVAAYFVPEAQIWHNKQLTVTLKTVFGLMGVAIIVSTLLGLQIQSFFGAIAMQPTVGAIGLGDVVANLQLLGIQPASVGSILVTTIGTVLGVIVINKYVYKRKLIKRR